MTSEELRAYCLGKPATTESFPFDEVTLVFKVAGKVFALVDLESKPLSLNLKCDPERAVELREQYETIQPGFHMNKKHWNTISYTGAIRAALLLELVDHSYELVVAGLPKTVRESLHQH